MRISVYQRLLCAPAPNTGSYLWTERSSISYVPHSFCFKVFMRAIGLCVLVKWLSSGLSRMLLSSIGASCLLANGWSYISVYSSWSSSYVLVWLVICMIWSRLSELNCSCSVSSYSGFSSAFIMLSSEGLWGLGYSSIPPPCISICWAPGWWARSQSSYSSGTIAYKMCLHAFSFDSFLFRPTAKPTSCSPKEIVVLKRAISFPTISSGWPVVGST